MYTKKKKGIAVVLILLLSLYQIPQIQVKADDYDIQSDIYGENYSEEANIAGMDYEYIYSYDNMGRRTIQIINTTYNEINTIIYDQYSMCILLDGNVCGTVSEVIHDIDNKGIDTLSEVNEENWIYFDSGDTTITFAQGIAVAVLAAMIAAVVGNLGGAGVIAAMGYNALSVIAASCIGGTVSTTIYKFNSNLLTQWRYDWSFTASSGDYYGVYTYLTAI